jgi:hypothetical protein
MYVRFSRICCLTKLAAHWGQLGPNCIYIGAKAQSSPICCPYGTDMPQCTREHKIENEIHPTSANINMPARM